MFFKCIGKLLFALCVCAYLHLINLYLLVGWLTGRPSEICACASIRTRSASMNIDSFSLVSCRASFAESARLDPLFYFPSSPYQITCSHLTISFEWYSIQFTNRRRNEGPTRNKWPHYIDCAREWLRTMKFVAEPDCPITNWTKKSNPTPTFAFCGNEIICIYQFQK